MYLGLCRRESFRFTTVTNKNVILLHPTYSQADCRLDERTDKQIDRQMQAYSTTDCQTNSRQKRQIYKVISKQISTHQRNRQTNQDLAVKQTNQNLSVKQTDRKISTF